MHPTLSIFSESMLPSSSITSNQSNIPGLGEIIELAPIETGPFIWPPAIGWWLLALVIAICFITVVIWTKRQLKSRAERQFLMAAFSNLPELPESANTEQQLDFFKALNKAVKAIALSRFGPKVSKLHGQQWLEFLDQTGRCNHFQKGGGQVLGNALYKREALDLPDANHLMAICQQWCVEVSKS